MIFPSSCCFLNSTYLGAGEATSALLATDKDTWFLKYSFQSSTERNLYLLLAKDTHN